MLSEIVAFFQLFAPVFQWPVCSVSLWDCRHYFKLTSIALFYFNAFLTFVTYRSFMAFGVLQLTLIYTMSQINSQNCFHHNFVIFQPTLIIFGTDMTKMIELCKVNFFSISPNLCQRNTVWNTDDSNCYIMWWLFVSDCSPLHHQFDRRCYAIK